MEELQKLKSEIEELKSKNDKKIISALISEFATKFFIKQLELDCSNKKIELLESIIKQHDTATK